MDADRLLYADEHVLSSVRANAVVPHRLTVPSGVVGQAFQAKVFAGVRMVMDAAGGESVGGRLTVTNWRLLFAAHAVNMNRGYFSVFWPTVRRVADASAFVNRRIEVTTEVLSQRYVVWGIPKLLRVIEGARAPGPDAESLSRAVEGDPRRAFSGASDVGGLAGAQASFASGGLGELARLASSSITVLGAIAAMELVAPTDSAPGTSACARCGAQVRAGDRFCPACGAAVVVTCATCGGEVSPHDRYCRGCGANLPS
jgi:hypothetical protein